MACHQAHGGRQRPRASWLEEQSIVAVADDLSKRRQVGRDDRRPMARYSNSFSGDV